jgi:hypothetical protein
LFFFKTTIYNWRWLALSTGADAALRPLRARHAETSRQEGQLEGGRWNEPKASFEVGEVKWFIYPDEVLPTINENKTLHIYVYINGLIDTVLLMYFYLCYKKELHDFRYWLWAIMFFVFFSDGSTINWVYGGYYTETGWVKLNNGDLLLIIWLVYFV